MKKGMLPSIHLFYMGAQETGQKQTHKTQKPRWETDIAIHRGFDTICEHLVGSDEKDAGRKFLFYA